MMIVRGARSASPSQRETSNAWQRCRACLLFSLASLAPPHQPHATLCNTAEHGPRANEHTDSNNNCTASISFSRVWEDPSQHQNASYKDHQASDHIRGHVQQSPMNI